MVDPVGPVELSVMVSNCTNSVSHGHRVRLVGTALPLTFFDYDTTVPFDVPAHTTRCPHALP